MRFSSYHGGGRLVARVSPSGPLPAVGETVSFDAAPGHLHCFDSTTGMRVS